MTITQHTRRRVVEAIPAEGAPLRVISATSGVHISNVRAVVKLMVEEHQVFTFRTGTGEGGKHEVWTFVDQAVRDYHAGQRARETEQRRFQREQARAAARKEQRNREEARNARSLAAERREAERARQRVLAQERAAAEQIARKATQAKLRTMTAAAGATVFKAGTLTPKARPGKFELQDAIVPEGLQPVELPCLLRERFAVTEAPSVVSSSECRPWARSAAA